MGARRAIRWGALTLAALAFVLVPFAFFDARLHGWTLERIHADAPAATIAISVVLLLAADIVLPIPSSLVSTAAGAGLGFLPGLAASVLGMSVGCQLGYWLGRLSDRLVVQHLVSRNDLAAVSRHFQKHGHWSLAATRPVPVLAEASVLLAGVARVNLARFSVVTLLANVGISFVYCAVGSAALQASSFLLAFGGAVAVPALAMWIVRGPRAREDTTNP